MGPKFNANIFCKLLIIFLKGIQVSYLDNKEIKISLLADDITLLHHDLNSVKCSINLLKLFHHCSDLNINIDKTQAKYIGSLTSSDYYPHGLMDKNTYRNTWYCYYR